MHIAHISFSTTLHNYTLHKLLRYCWQDDARQCENVIGTFIISDLSNEACIGANNRCNRRIY